jgi:hypothetical protein
MAYSLLDEGGTSSAAQSASGGQLGRGMRVGEKPKGVLPASPQKAPDGIRGHRSGRNATQAFLRHNERGRRLAVPLARANGTQAAFLALLAALGAFFNVSLEANSCLTLRAMASVFTLYTVAVVEMSHLLRTKWKGFAVARNFARHHSPSDADASVTMSRPLCGLDRLRRGQSIADTAPQWKHGIGRFLTCRHSLAYRD